MAEPGPLPIDPLRPELIRRLGEGPVVVTSPTGSGKSTQVPRWCAELGRILVVEPRRVACRSLALWVSGLHGCRLGEEVGYSVRDDHRAGPGTRILYATPGIVLRMLARGDPGEFETVILDEFHERSLDVDLLLSLFLKRFRGRLVVMSATLDGEVVARHIGGRHLRAEGRVFPVEYRYLTGDALLPDGRGLEARIKKALDAAPEDLGDVLVFLPGKAEISGAAQALHHRRDLRVLELHGGLTLEEQSRAFRRADRRKVILSTNVAETSITLPGIGVVIDSGLVRQTRYHGGRGFLTLVPVATDSADQRAGRAGRTRPGVCYRLWSEAALLEKSTLPEIYRESLMPLILDAAACGEQVDALPFLDPPKDHAVTSARDELGALEALSEQGVITERGRQIFGLPLDAELGNLLIEAEARGALPDAIDLVAALAVGRPLFTSRPPLDGEDDLRRGGCDARAVILAIRMGEARRHGLNPFTLKEARVISARLRKAWDLPERPDPKGAINSRRLAFIALAADPRCSHVARSRGRRTAWSNGGTEIELGRESAVAAAEKVEAIAVLQSRAVGLGRRDTRIIATCAIPLQLSWLIEAGLGRDRLGGVSVKGGRVIARVERVYARRVLDAREETPERAMAREALRDLFVRGSIFPAILEQTRERLEAAALYGRLRADGFAGEDWDGSFEETQPPDGPVPTLEEWVLDRLESLGVESGDDLAILAPEDLLAPDLPDRARSRIDKEYPRALSVGDAVYRVSYDLHKKEVTLHKVKGQRKELPPLAYLPPFTGFRILVKDRAAVRVLRE